MLNELLKTTLKAVEFHSLKITTTILFATSNVGTETLFKRHS